MGFRDAILLDHLLGPLRILRQPLRQKDVEDSDHEEQGQGQKLFDVYIDLKVNESKVIEYAVQDAHDEERNQNQPQIAPQERKDEYGKKTQIEVITWNSQQTQGKGNKNEIQDRNTVQGVIGRKLLMRNEHQDYIGERKRKGDTKRHRKLFGADIAEQK
jgi:hypothetical protein